MAHPQQSSTDCEDKTSITSLSPRVQDEHNGSAFIKQTAGVTRMEALGRLASQKKGRNLFIGIAVAIYACVWVSAMEGSTTYSYAIWATSDFQQHSSGLASLTIATGIISSVCLPFLAKFADVFSRSWVYAFALVSYVVGFIIIAFSPNITAYVIGSVLVAIGGAALSFLSSVVSADLIPLEWRGLAYGVLASPYLATVWYTSSIAGALGNAKNWRWGFGMYIIIMPVIMGPAIVAIIYLERKARRMGLLDEAQKDDVSVDDLENKDTAGVEGVVVPEKLLRERAVQAFHEMDAVGLIFLGFGWSLLLLPFSLSAYANGGYRNPSLIAMFAVGAVLLVIYGLWEVFYARFPTAPRRLLTNRTFSTAIIIDVIYMIAGYMNLTYVYSYVYVVTDFTDEQQNYYNNVLTMGLCSFGLVWGGLQRYTHRYKLIQLIGLSIKIVGFGLFVSKTGVRSKAALVIGQLLIGIGGSASVVASQVASQASVPHQDVALVISLLSLWTAIGAGVGSAISAAVWNARLPGLLRVYLPAAVSDEEVATFFGSIVAIKAYPLGDPIREGCIRAYIDTVYPLWAGALGVSFVALIAAMFQTNYYLGEQQNAVTNTDIAGRPVAVPEPFVPKTKMQRILHFWDL